MPESSITFFPVQNGDTNLLQICNGDGLTNVIIDSHFCDNGSYNVSEHVLQLLPAIDGIPHLDAFILTHPHEDHVLGFKDFYYTGNPDDYSKEDMENGIILVDELWFAPKIFNDKSKDLCDDAIAFRREAQRRIGLYKTKDSSREKAGNRLRIIGATEHEELSELKEITTFAGQTVNLINNKIHDNFRFFVYAPIKQDSDDDSINPNNTSIVFQARFDIDGVENAVKIFMGGDAECPIWERIVNRNNDENLTWDLFLAPHHCSWSFFSLDPYIDESEPSETILHLLDQKRGNAIIVSSSKPIKDNDDNPPSYKAKNIYAEKVGINKFICTGEHPNEKSPTPIHFVFSSEGVVKTELPDTDNKSRKGLFSAVTSTPRIYG